MFNLNTSLSTPLLGIDMSQTPRTPEILNSLIAMTNPLEYSFSSASSGNSLSTFTSTITPLSTSGTGNDSQVSKDSFLHQLDTQSNCSSSSVESPATTPTTPSLQQTRSQLIKAGVKLLIQNKRKHSGSTSSNDQPPVKLFIPSPSSTAPCEKPIETSRREKIISKPKTDSTTSCDDDSESKMSTGMPGLTPEDEERRRRRRERNKIAATKCRMKKREKTINLVKESETLEIQNVEMKSQLRDLESQRVKLTEMLRVHRLECVNQHLVMKSRTLEDYKLNPSSYNQKFRIHDNVDHINDNNNNETKGDNKSNVMINNVPSINHHNLNNNIPEELPSFMQYKYMNDDTTSSQNMFDFNIEMFNSEDEYLKNNPDNEWEVKYSHTLNNSNPHHIHHHPQIMPQNVHSSLLHQQNTTGAPHLSHVQIKNEHDQQTMYVKC